ncbi:MAG: hypothetical protein WC992_04510 [Acholeplasmataceae bacterium]|jgi:hypothetical protein|nr:hypothetical protein [Acholeplasmataceae bacterium]
MKVYNIKSDLPRVELAAKRLEMIIKYEKEPIIKIIHGYGSSGLGGKIKEMVHQTLEMMKSKHQIKDFIPGEAFGYLLGFDEKIKKYRNLLATDSDYRKVNEGITYILI